MVVLNNRGAVLRPRSLRRLLCADDVPTRFPHHLAPIRAEFARATPIVAAFDRPGIPSLAVPETARACSIWSGTVAWCLDRAGGVVCWRTILATMAWTAPERRRAAG